MDTMPRSSAQPLIGILGLQGAFAEHHSMMARIGVATRDVRLPEHLEGVSGLIIPGGESTVIGKLMVKYALDTAIAAFARAGGAIWGTCAGLILLASDVGREQPLLRLMDVRVERNAYGSQLFSFEEDIDLPTLNIRGLRAVFIRAPIVTATGPDVDVLARDARGNIVAVQSGNLLGTAFHPELTNDVRLHAYFASLAAATQVPAIAA